MLSVERTMYWIHLTLIVCSLARRVLTVICRDKELNAHDSIHEDYAVLVASGTSPPPYYESCEGDYCIVSTASQLSQTPLVSI